MKPKLLIVELWGLGDLAIATPFLRAAAEKYSVTLLAKPFARDLQPRLWPDVQVEAFTAPWTAFQHKYQLWQWPWLEMEHLRRRLTDARFDLGLSARWDPRDHLLLQLAQTRERLGFARIRSEIFLTRPLMRPHPEAHRYEFWQTIARELHMELPPRKLIFNPAPRALQMILLHTGAAQPVRVWPLEKFQTLAARLRQQNFQVQIACDPDQQDWWRHVGEMDATTPANVTELLGLIDRAGTFIGNDSGPGHLAAICGVPTFTLFGPQLPEWFAPLHPASDWIPGRGCPFKPCSDYCRFPAPFCLHNLGEEEVFERVGKFLAAQVSLMHSTMALS
ncbi:MAG: glycosyltransferase family 9 protein [Limisphaerales bacterium]